MEMLGLVALTNGDELFLGIEIKLPEADHIRQLVGPVIQAMFFFNVHIKSSEGNIGGIGNKVSLIKMCGLAWISLISRIW